MTLARRSTGRNRGGWSKAALAYLEHVQGVLQDLSEYWPLTLRQAYYQLVAEGFIENKKPQYQKLSRVLTKARLDGLVPWEAIEDRTRTTLASGGWEDSGEFIQDQLADLLTGYRRDLLQHQDVALEIWIEKDALSRICHEVAFGFCVPVVVARGFSSVSYVHGCRKRIDHNASLGKRTRILYFGDLDPSGWAMLPAMLETLQHEMELGDLVEGHRCALTPEQVEAHHLPHSIDALKLSDPRAGKYREQFGDLAVELDALRPSALQKLVRDSIEEHLDSEDLEGQRESEDGERRYLEKLRQRMLAFAQEVMEEGGDL